MVHRILYMIPIRAIFPVYIALAAWFCMYGCSDTPSPTQAGSATQTTNTIAVSVDGQSITGSAPVGIKLSVVSDGYLPHSNTGIKLTDTVGPDTLYSLGPLPPGIYTLLAQSAGGDSAQIFKNLAIGISSRTSQTDSLRAAEDISGLVQYNGVPKDSAWIFIQGTPFYAKSDEYGEFSLKGLPPGLYDIQAEYTAKTKGEPVLTDTVSNYPVGMYANPDLILDLK